MEIKKQLVLAVLLFVFGGCKTIDVQNLPVDPNNPGDHIGTMRIPPGKKDDFQKAAILVIQIVNSLEFEHEVQTYYSRLVDGGEYSSAWSEWTTAKIVTGMRTKIQGLEISTYGGPGALFSHVFSGNIAYDGASSGPIRMNRVGLNSRSVADICNTIAHETAHRVGMVHPHSSIPGKFKVALCEPPYVIGSIVKKLALSGNWKADSNDCSCFKNIE